MKTVWSLECANLNTVTQSNRIASTFSTYQLKEEMTDSRLLDFVSYLDEIYHNAWVQHYSDFNPNAPLLS